MQESFKNRVNKFWKSFDTDEHLIREMMDNKVDGESLVTFVDNVLQVAFNSVYFEMGISKEGKYELILTPEGDRIKLIQLHYWLQKAPAHLSEKWNFYSSKPAHATASASIRMYGIDLTVDDLRIYPEIDNEQRKVNLEIYAPKLDSLKENERYNLFFIYLDQFIGEIYTMEYINFVDFVPTETDKMPVLISDLREFVTNAISENEWNNITNPFDVYSGYSVKPSEEKDWTLRQDIYTGYTNCISLQNNFYEGESEQLTEMQKDGISFGFLFFENINVPNEEIVDFRAKIEDAITDRAAGQGIADSLGGASGFHFSYIDFVIYDMDEFLAIAKDVLDAYKFEESGFSTFIAKQEPIMW